MAAELYLIAPDMPDPETFPVLLAKVLDAASVAALLLTMGDEAQARRLTGIAQDRGCAVLLKDRPDLVRKLGADGAHMTGGQQVFAEAVKLLSPDFMVGAGALHSRHEAMLRGEGGADYVMFGPLAGKPQQDDLELADWWAENFVTPSVLSQPGTNAEDLLPTICEFIALGEGLWSLPDPAESIRLIAETETA